MNYNLNRFYHGLQELDINLSEDQIKQFLIYYEMLIEKNKVMNLTAITEFDEVVEKHFLDSLSLVEVADLHKSQKVLDLGTGAGTWAAGDTGECCLRIDQGVKYGNHGDGCSCRYYPGWQRQASVRCNHVWCR